MDPSRMTRFLLLGAALVTLAACDPAATGGPGAGAGIANPFAPPPPPAPPTLPPQVAAVLPPGTSPNLVFEDGNGCYLFSVEATDPPTGFPVRDALGNQICEDGTRPIAPPVVVAANTAIPPGAAVSAPTASAPLTPGSITPPAPIAPVR